MERLIGLLVGISATATILAALLMFGGSTEVPGAEPPVAAAAGLQGDAGEAAGPIIVIPCNPDCVLFDTPTPPLIFCPLCVFDTPTPPLIFCPLCVFDTPTPPLIFCPLCPPADTPTPIILLPADTATPTPGAIPPTDTPDPADTPTDTPVPGGLLGDVDCSGAVNAIDAAFLLQMSAALIGAVPCPQNADPNEDGLVNAIDSTLILQFSAGLIGSLPP